MPATTIEVSPSPEQILDPPRPAQAHRIASDEEALKIARQLSHQFSVDAAKRDRERILPQADLNAFSGSELWALSIPKNSGGAEVRHETLVGGPKLPHKHPGGIVRRQRIRQLEPASLHV
jgi:hypothetical protein